MTFEEVDEKILSTVICGSHEFAENYIKTQYYDYYKYVAHEIRCRHYSKEAVSFKVKTNNCKRKMLLERITKSQVFERVEYSHFPVTLVQASDDDFDYIDLDKEETKDKKKYWIFIPVMGHDDDPVTGCEELHLKPSTYKYFKPHHLELMQQLVQQRIRDGNSPKYYAFFRASFPDFPITARQFYRRFHEDYLRELKDDVREDEETMYVEEPKVFLPRKLGDRYRD